MSSNSFNLWFICKLCKCAFKKSDEYCEHKKEKHLSEFEKTYRCIVFEEVTTDIIDTIIERNTGKLSQNFIQDADSTVIVETTTDEEREKLVKVENAEVEVAVEVKQEPPDLLSNCEETLDDYDISNSSMHNYDSSGPKIKIVSVQSLSSNPVQQPVSKTDLKDAKKLKKGRSTKARSPYDAYVSIKKLTVKEIKEHTSRGSKNSSQANAGNNSTSKSSGQNSSVQNSSGPMSELKCRICAKEFRSRKKCREHEEIHKPKEERPRPFVCKICGTSFLTKCTLTRHQRFGHTEDRPFKCPHPNCKSAFKDQSSFNNHVKWSTCGRSFWCLYRGCKSTFNTQEDFDLHCQIHSQPGPSFLCTRDNCGLLFSEPHLLSNHIQRFHIPQEIALITDLPGFDSGIINGQPQPAAPVYFYAVQPSSPLINR